MRDGTQMNFVTCRKLWMFEKRGAERYLSCCCQSKIFFSMIGLCGVRCRFNILVCSDGEISRYITLAPGAPKLHTCCDPKYIQIRQRKLLFSFSLKQVQTNTG